MRITTWALRAALLLLPLFVFSASAFAQDAGTATIAAEAAAAAPAAPAESFDIGAISKFFSEGRWMAAIGAILTMLILGLRKLGFKSILPAKHRGLYTTVTSGLLVVAASMVVEADLLTIITAFFTSIAAPLFMAFTKSDKEEVAAEGA